MGINAGSLERKLQIKYGEPNADALVESALGHINILQQLNFNDFKLSIKASDVFLTIESYRKISKLIDQPLHLGVTEAGGFRSGTVKSAVGMGALLLEGIGDTLRVSLASDPVDEIKIAPNPFINQLHIESSSNGTWHLKSITGKSIAQGQLISNTPLTINTQSFNLNAGVYLLELNTPQKTFIKQVAKL